MSAKRTAILVGVVAAASVAYYLRRRVEAVPDPRLTALPPSPPRVDRMVYSADGTGIHVTEYGPADAPTVVLAHGWTCSTGFWTLVIRALSADLHVVAYDLRGHAGSEPPGPAQFSTDALADDLAAVLDATVPDGRQAVVVGHSMGAMSVVALAARHRGLLRRKVAATLLANTAVTDLVNGSLLQPGPEGLRTLTAPLVRQILGASLPLGRPSSLTLPLVRYIALAPDASPEQVAFCAHILLETPRRVRGGFGGTLGRLDLRAAVAHVEVPAVVVVGEHDRLTPASHGRRMAEELPHARLVEIDGVGHMTPVEAPDVLEREIRRLVREHLPASAAS